MPPKQVKGATRRPQIASHGGVIYRIHYFF